MLLQKRDIAMAIAGAGLFGSFLHITTLSHYTIEGFDYVATITLAFVCYFAILLLLLWMPQPRLSWIVTVALLCRIVLWVDTPTLSTDVWRYLWDGRLINAGINPYSYRVDDPQLDDLRTVYSQRVEHRRMATPYPPFAQLAFATTVAIWAEEARTMQIVFTFFDLASGGLIILLLRSLGRPDKWVTIYLLNPLIMIEFAHGAHVDSLMSFFILLALYFHTHSQGVYSSLALAFATLTKYIPAILLPIFLRRWQVSFVVLFLVFVFVAFIPFLGAGLGIGEQDDGSGIFGAVRIYSNEWKSNDGFFYWLALRLDPYSHDPIQSARLLSNVILILFGGWILFQTPPQALPQRIIENTAILISVYLLLVAAMFPWYLTWLLVLLPLLPFHRKTSTLLLMLAWLYFSWAVQVSYLIYINPADPREEIWMRYVEYVPLFGILLGAVLVWLWEQWRLSRSALLLGAPIREPQAAQFLIEIQPKDKE